MERKLVYSTNGKSLLGDVTNPQKLQALILLIRAWEKVNEKILAEVLSERVTFIDAGFASISGVDSVIWITHYFAGYVEFHTGYCPILKVYLITNKDVDDVFFIEVYDSNDKELYYSFSVFFKDDRIIEIDLQDNIIMDAFHDHLNDERSNKDIKFI